ncbi:hypothetical protein CSA37_01265 [Candidatus Fermentibacteria bacterium]|nr:MAG: hypothetical protein CSA37_09050 [Candidatus Fermentibacteria bacterium]PIE53250.1 MAG: hypothetical protein CSA37_02595 [Candidatus Fermentibacteria bacterium]PIE53479.1 MAG: hypothetical protein CSA37_01265 [Candidatus Fermentibacteria bacterium]
MSGLYLSTENQPFCRGCGHSMVSRALEKALSNIENLNLLDLIVVTDIGCIGIIDKQFNCHTVHGLHGRAVALATGISMGLNDPSKKILVMLGDGGATIGMQHIIEAAHLNINMTVIVHNNMLYGMTGGQSSGLTPLGFKTPAVPEGRIDNGIDICSLVHSAGAAYARRIYALGDFSDALEEALRVDGFSLVEAVEFCPSHGVKHNPGKKLNDLTEPAGLLPVLMENKDKKPHSQALRYHTESLLDSVKKITVKYNHNLEGRATVLLAGSAGEGVQSAAELLAKAAMSCGLSVTKKGSYPVTVGVGFSLSELIISTEEIDFTGIETIDTALVTSEEGMKRALSRITSMKEGTLFLDSSLEAPETSAEVRKLDYRKPMGARTASLLSAADFIQKSGIIPVESFYDALAASRLGSKISRERIETALSQLTD